MPRAAGNRKRVRRCSPCARTAKRRTGAIMLTDAAGKLTGIFTDSDLARLFESRRDTALDRPICEVMTAEPCTVPQGSMMVDAIAIMAERKISELPVIDADGRPLGLIDITDVVAAFPDLQASPRPAELRVVPPPKFAGPLRSKIALFTDSAARAIMKLDERCQAIELLLADVDGVLTDGHIVFDNQGIETKHFHIRDGMGIKLWQRAGYKFGLVTGRSSHIVKIRAAELGVDIVRQTAEDKLPAVQEIVRQLGLVAGTSLLHRRRPARPAGGARGGPGRGGGRRLARSCAQRPIGRAACAGGDGAVRETIEMILKVAAALGRVGAKVRALMAQPRRNTESGSQQPSAPRAAGGGSGRAAPHPSPRQPAQPFHAGCVRVVASFGIVLSVYVAYALAVVPLIEPSVDQDRRAQPTAAAASARRAPMCSRRYFPPGSWELKNPKILESERAMLLIKDYQNLPDGRVKLHPCTVVFFSSDSTRDELKSPPVILQAPEGAILKFDEPFDLKRAKVGRLIGGSLVGKVTIRRDPSRPGAADDLRVTTRDVELTEDRVVTPASGRFSLRAQLRQRPRNDDPAGPQSQERRRQAGRRKERHRHHRRQVVRAGPRRPHAHAAGGQRSARRHDQPARRAPPRRTAEPPVEVTCQGPFHFNLDKYIATFTDQVDVLRLNTNGPSDQMNCELLSIFFERRDQADGKAKAGTNGGQVASRSVRRASKRGWSKPAAIRSSCVLPRPAARRVPTAGI